MARFAKRHLQRGARILDAGCGIGANAIWLTQEGYVVDGVDISTEAIRRLHFRSDGFEWNGVDLHSAQVGDITDLQFRDGMFDAVIEVCVLQHVSDPLLAIKEAYRVLKHGGQMFSMIATPNHFLKAFPEGVHVKLWTAQEVADAFSSAGFVIEWMGSQIYDDEAYGVIEHWLVRTRKI